MNKRRLFSAAALTALLALHSCDTRDDYFYEHCDPPMVTVKEMVGDSVISVYGERFLYVEINWGETKTIQFDYNDPYGDKVSDYDIHFRAMGWNDNGNRYLDPAYKNDNFERSPSYPFNEKYVDFRIDNANNRIVVTDKTKSALEHRTPGSRGEITNSFDGSTFIYLKNRLGKAGYATVFIFFRTNLEPKPVITTKKGSIKNEIIIMVDGNDPNGDEIDKYEYCIDGTTMPLAGGYEIENAEEYYTPLAKKSGEGAYNGTYITATELSSIKHIFQWEGEHTISVRCKDKWGFWSDWVTEKITI